MYKNTFIAKKITLKMITLNNRTRLFALTLLSVLVFESSLTGFSSAQMGPVMNDGPDFTPLSINVLTPLNNHVYSSNFELKFIVTKPASWFTSGAVVWNYGCQGEITYLHYSIDGKPKLTIPANDTAKGISETPIPTTATFKIPLEELNAGWHSIIVSLDGWYYYWSSGAHPEYSHNAVGGSSEKILFYVDNEGHTWGGFISPSQSALPPKISILSPNSTLFTSSNVLLSFKVTTTKDTAVLTDVSYNIALRGNVESERHIDETPPTTHYTETLTDLSDGNYTLNVFAAGVGSFVAEDSIYVYNLGSTSSFNFVVDSVIPVIAPLSPEDGIYGLSDVVLNFSSNKPIERFIYSLDGAENSTATGGSFLSLTGLTNGKHVAIVYGQDEFGVVSSPINVSFNVNVAPSVAPIYVVVIVLALCFVVALIFSIKKFRRQSAIKESFHGSQFRFYYFLCLFSRLSLNIKNLYRLSQVRQEELISEDITIVQLLKNKSLCKGM